MPNTLKPNKNRNTHKENSQIAKTLKDKIQKTNKEITHTHKEKRN